MAAQYDSVTSIFIFSSRASENIAVFCILSPKDVVTVRLDLRLALLLLSTIYKTHLFLKLSYNISLHLDLSILLYFIS